MLYLKAIKATQMEWQLENLKIVHFTWVSQPCNAKNTVNTTVFDSMDGAGVEPTTSGLQAARGGISLIVSGNARIQPLAFSLLKQEELQLA